MENEKYPQVVRGSEKEIEARKVILDLFKNSPIYDDEILVNLGLYLRSTVLAKVLYINELYTKILNIPGNIMEFGCQWGSNIALYESFRSVYEPYNWTRKVVAFDTFEGYTKPNSIDGNSIHVDEGGYSVPENYIDHLTSILDAHEADNFMSHIKKYEIIKGDVNQTIDAYLKNNPQTIISLAYFDLALYEPTIKCLKAIRPFLVKGSVLAMDELNSSDFPGETVALREIIGLDKFKIVKSKFLPDRSFLIIE